MKYNPLGKSELNVSKIGFGCMSLKGDAKTNQLMIDRALELGINYFDTADLYENGANEEKLASLLKTRRNQVTLATKVGNQYRADGTGWDWNPRRSYILSAVEDSLKRLKTDYIDLYQLHGGTLEDPIDEIIETFEQLKQQGKIRYYGISSIRPNVIREYVKRSGIVSVMLQYSLLDRRPEESCFELLQENQIGVLARGSIAQGLLIDKPAAPYLDWSAAAVAKAAEAIKAVTTGSGNPAQTAIRFVLQQQGIASAVLGLSTLAQLEDLATVADLPALTAEEMHLLEEAAVQHFYKVQR